MTRTHLPQLPLPAVPRRRLLAAAACSPLAALAALRGAPAQAAAPVAGSAPSAAPAAATYHDTEHAQRYYRSAARL